MQKSRAEWVENNRKVKATGYRVDLSGGIDTSRAIKTGSGMSISQELLQLDCLDAYRVRELYDLREEKPPAHSGHL